MTKPLVSVLMPCYNVATYIEQALASILNQTYTNIEIIAINDCSQDTTRSILERMATQDVRIKLINNAQNLKLIATLNQGISYCKGEYIARMDADDIALPTRIEKEVAFLEANKEYDIVSSLFYAFSSKKPSKKTLHHNPLLHEELQAYMLFKSGICHPAVMIRKRVFSALNLNFGLEYLHVEDYALWSQAIYKTKLANIGEPLLLYRVHTQQVSALNEALQIENKKKVFKIHCQHLGLPYDDEALDIYSSVAESNPKESSMAYLAKCELFMISLVELNKQKPFCSGVYLQQLLSIHWLRLCANAQLGLSVLGRLKSSPFYVGDNYTTRDFIILYIKCIFKLQYKHSLIYKILFR